MTCRISLLMAVIALVFSFAVVRADGPVVDADSLKTSITKVRDGQYNIKGQVMAEVVKVWNHTCRGRTALCPHCGDSGKFIELTVIDWRCDDMPDAIRDSATALKFKIGPNPDLPPARGPVRGEAEEKKLAEKHGHLAEVKPGQKVLLQFNGTARANKATGKFTITVANNDFKAVIPGAAGNDEGGLCTWPVNISLKTPSSAEIIKAKDVRIVDNEVWVLWEVARAGGPGGFGLAVISEASATIYLPPTDKPLRQFLIGKNWNWGDAPQDVKIVGTKEAKDVITKAEAGQKVRFTDKPEKKKPQAKRIVREIFWKTDGGGELYFSIKPKGDDYIVQIHEAANPAKIIGKSYILRPADGETFDLVHGLFTGAINANDHKLKPNGGAAGGTWTKIIVTNAAGKKTEVPISSRGKLGPIYTWVNANMLLEQIGDDAN